MIQLPFLKADPEKTSITVLESPIPQVDRRKEPRYAADGWAKVVVPFLAEPVTYAARVLDVSRGGMRLMLRAPLEPGTLLQIEMKSVVATGEVRHCRPEGEQYAVGVQLDEVANNEETI
jgi:hypothetical protein